MTRSDEFRTAWAKHDVRLHHTGRKSFRHPVVGPRSTSTPWNCRPGLILTACSAAPGTPEHDALQLLAVWAATRNPPPTGQTDRAATPVS
ncbi:hypothetical protein ACFWBB_32385 [Streptomyces sp. NPDC060000]|uniref:MmyB family transcriptional regulator n=1 Tax=Streptomyces sp. NPDC060000 TaxID=3347031 RepID=UPI00368916B5